MHSVSGSIAAETFPRNCFLVVLWDISLRLLQHVDNGSESCWPEWGQHNMFTWTPGPLVTGHPYHCQTGAVVSVMSDIHCLVNVSSDWLSACKLLANIPMLFSHSCCRQFSGQLPSNDCVVTSDELRKRQQHGQWILIHLATHSLAELISRKVPVSLFSMQ